MNSQEFVLLLIVLIFAFGLLKRRMGFHRPWEQPPAMQNNAETIRLRQELQELKDRIKVLERITVDKENSLANEIESLRDK